MAPAGLSTITGLTRCLFTLGYCVLPAFVVPMLQATSLVGPAALAASLFVLSALLLQMAAKLPPASTNEAGRGDSSEREHRSTKRTNDGMPSVEVEVGRPAQHGSS